MTTGSQLAVIGKREERLLYNANEERAPSWAVLALLGCAESVARHGGSGVAKRLGWLGGLGWPAGAGARPAGLESVRGLWSQAGLSSRAKSSFSILA